MSKQPKPIKPEDTEVHYKMVNGELVAMTPQEYAEHVANLPSPLPKEDADASR